jgi:hypothetical protein
MKHLFLILILCAPVLAHAQGSEGKGGGSGCMAEVMQSVNRLNNWLTLNEGKIKVSASQFAATARPELFQFVPEIVDLQYKGNPVDAFFDGEHVKIRCDRLLKNSQKTQALLIAHEVFRRLGLEGDDYEVTKRMNLAPIAVTTSTQQQPVVKAQQLPATANGTVPCRIALVTDEAGKDDTNIFMNALNRTDLRKYITPYPRACGTNAECLKGIDHVMINSYGFIWSNPDGHDEWVRVDISVVSAQGEVVTFNSQVVGEYSSDAVVKAVNDKISRQALLNACYSLQTMNQ